MKNIKYLVVFIVTFFSFGFNIYAIKDIKVDGESLSPLFERDVYVYNYFTFNDNVVISVVHDEKEEVTGYGNFRVISGENNFILTSIIDGKREEYKINIFKDYEKDTDNSSAILESLNISGYDIDFNSAIYDYEIVIGDEESLDISYETISELSNVKINGNSNFNKSDNVIEIVVTSGDGNNKSIYKIHAKKAIEVFKNVIATEDVLEEFTDLDKGISIVGIVTIGSSVIVFMFYLLFLRKRKRI